MYWIIICVIAIVVFAFLAKFFSSDRFKWNNGVYIASIGAICGVVVFILVLVAMICTKVNYHRFEIQIEIQRAQYQELINKDFTNPDNIILIEDIVNINEELSHMQASKICYKNWSLYPERVLDIQPIGLE